MILHVTDVEYLCDYTLICSFNNGERRKVDLSPLLDRPAFSELRNPEKFIQFGLLDTILWSNGADIAPEWLLENGIPA